MVKVIGNSGLLVFLLWSLNVGAADAVEYSVSYSSSAQITPLSLYYGQPFDLPQFNPALGEMQTIKVEMEFYFSGDVHLGAPMAEEPLDINLGDITAFFKPELYADSAPIPCEIEQIIPISGSISPGYDQIIYENFYWQDQYNVEVANVSYCLDEYIGLGKSPLGIGAGLSSADKMITVFMDGTLDVDCTLTYIYTVPEPIGLLMMAAGGIAVLRKR